MRNRNIRSLHFISFMTFLTAFTVVSNISTNAQTIFNSYPDWVSSDHEVSTGAAFADLDLDGYLDLIVANGNDIYRQRVVVYYNKGDGTFPTTPDWQSSDQKYNGHLDIADVNGDGYPDVAVGHLVNENGPAAKVYLNNSGVLSTTPDWTSAENEPAFGVSFGDVNNDGRPDLAVATGWPYDTIHNAHNYIYLNIGGSLEISASWVSDDTFDYSAFLWVDSDNDGWLDLVGTGNNTDSWMYHNNNGNLETAASWRTTDNSAQFAIMATAGDVNGDGALDMFITDNTQLYGGNGRFRQYNGLPAGYFNQTPNWSYYDGYGSAIALADVNADGLLDLATGAWWDRTRLFYNNGSGFNANSSWDSGGTSVVEKIVFGDVNPACGNDMVYTHAFTPDGDRRLFYLPHQQIQRVISVKLDGMELMPSEYHVNREHGWISVIDAPQTMLTVQYGYSTSQDMAISNWDSSLGNYLYYNQKIRDCNNNSVADGCDIFNGTSKDDNGNGIPDECESGKIIKNGNSGTHKTPVSFQKYKP